MIQSPAAPVLSPAPGLSPRFAPLWPDRRTDWVQSADPLPAVGGAYALWITLSDAAEIPARFGPASLAPGEYLYCGSAYGPGGIRARCRRHLKHEKGRRWHVDWLTTQAADCWVLAFPSGKECDLVRAVHSAGGKVPIPGFGSSDCSQCESHLLALPAALFPR